MSAISEGVYWCARDLAGLAFVGNHHFILLVTSRSNFTEIAFKPEKEKGIHFCTLGGFKEDNDRLHFRLNDEHDVKATREYINPDEHTSILLPDLDLEPHKVTPPQGSTLEFIKTVAQLAQNYQTNTKQSAPQYQLIDDNCSAWINTLFAITGVSEGARETYGEFFGIDWGEEDLIDKALFRN